VTFTYSFSSVHTFTSHLRLSEEPTSKSLRDPAGQTALFHIGLCILPWLWFGFAVPDVRIRAGLLSEEQVGARGVCLPSLLRIGG
jgi:hypothetical protein